MLSPLLIHAPLHDLPRGYAQKLKQFNEAKLEGSRENSCSDKGWRYLPRNYEKDVVSTVASCILLG